MTPAERDELIRAWTPAEVEYLKSNYGSLSNLELKEKLGRSDQAIKIKASRLRLGSCLRYRSIRAVSDSIRKADTSNMTSDQICETFGISRTQFYRLSDQFHIPFKRYSTKKNNPRVRLLGHDMRLKRYSEKRMSVHHIDGNPENNDQKNRIELQQGVHFVAHQVARDRKKFIKPGSVFFIGKAGTGKTTWAEYLCGTRGHVRMSFANKVKEIARNEFGMKEKDRVLLQIIGRTGRALDPFLWIKCLLDDARGLVAVDDCRFLNEFLVLKLVGMRSVYLECPAGLRAERVGTVGANDISETELESLRQWADLVLDTSASTADNEKILDSFLAQIFLEGKDR